MSRSKKIALWWLAITVFCSVFVSITPNVIINITNVKVKYNKDNLKDLYLEEREDGEWVYLSYFYIAEKNIAEKLIALDKSKNIKEIKNFKVELEKVESKQDIILSEEQKEAINAVNSNNVCIITGGPGTGKTTIIKSIIEIYEAKKKKVVLCAPTGRAAKRMQEQTGKEASEGGEAGEKEGSSSKKIERLSLSRIKR